MKYVIAFLLNVCLFSAIYGNYQSSPCSWGLSAEYLYLQPIFDQSYYTQEIQLAGDELPAGKRYDNAFDHKSAYRLYASGILCESELQLVWTHLPKTHQSTSQSRASFTLLATAGMPTGDHMNFASSRIDFQYYAVDALIKNWGQQWCGFRYKLSTGLHFAHFDFKETITYRNSAGPILVIFTNESKSNGIGPEIDWEMFYDFSDFQGQGCHGLSLVSKIKLGLLANHNKNDFNRYFNGPNSFSNEEPRWHLITMWAMRLGAHYEKVCSCLRLGLEIGYEMLSYRDPISRLFFSNPISTGESLDLYSKADFHGPYVAVECKF